MPFGGFAPLPLRLGPSAQEAWSAAQHARMADAVASMYSVGRFAVMHYEKSGAVVTVTFYAGRNGVGLQYAPTPTVVGNGSVLWTWPAQWDDALGETHLVRLVGAHASAHSTGGVGCQVTGASSGFHGRTITVTTTDTVIDTNIDAPVTLLVKGVEGRRIGDYGGAADKRDSRTEGQTPFAWIWYEHFRHGMGAAYNAEDRETIQHAENIAHARTECAISRAAERLAHNGSPWTCDETLARWAEVLGVPWVESESNEALRARCAAKYRMARGNDYQTVDEACAQVLGEAFVRIWILEGTDLATPPSPTMWPTINPGPASYDLGGGTWLSARSHLVVETTQPPGMADSDYLRLLNGDLYEMLSATLPAWVTFNWAENLGTGFLLDISKLDFTGISP